MSRDRFKLLKRSCDHVVKSALLLTLPFAHINCFWKPLRMFRIVDKAVFTSANPILLSRRNIVAACMVEAQGHFHLI